MHHDLLAKTLAPLGCELSPTSPGSTLRELERRADAEPRDRALSDAIHALHGLITASRGLPPTICGVQREELLCWDHWTTTWCGRDLATGRPARVRVVRAPADPILVRALARDAHALTPVVRVLRSAEGAMATVLDPLGTEPAPLRGFVQALTAADEWRRAGIGVPPDHPAPVTVVDGCARPLSLTPGPSDARALYRTVVAWLSERVTSEHRELADALGAFPVDDSDTLVTLFREHLGRDLTDRWLGLAGKRATQSQDDRRGRLTLLLARLRSAVPPPRGTAAVGVDLEGRVTVVQSDGEQVVWDDSVIVSRDHFDVRAGRRLLRARAAAMPSERLQADVDGSTETLEHITRWLGASMRLRTVTLLVDR